MQRRRRAKSPRNLPKGKKPFHPVLNPTGDRPPTIINIAPPDKWSVYTDDELLTLIKHHASALGYMAYFKDGKVPMENINKMKVEAERIIFLVKEIKG